jgi:DeoR/GlpR family transcriptional regulator of sugar metabolism
MLDDVQSSDGRDRSIEDRRTSHSTRERRDQIREILATRDYVSLRDLADRFGLSDMSVRRDLAALEDQGLLERVRGGAIPSPASREGSRFDPGVPLRTEQKRRIGAAAAGLLESSCVAFVDGGTTTVEVASAIPSGLRRMITLVTHSQRVLECASRWESSRLIALGGFYVPEHRIFAGPQTLTAINDLRADLAFVGCDGLSADDGLTTIDQLAGEVVGAMVERARKVVVVADSSKLGLRGFSPVAPTTSISVVVTDDGADQQQIDALRGRGVTVILA